MVRTHARSTRGKQCLLQTIASASAPSDCLIRRPSDDPPESEQCLLSPASEPGQSRIAAMPVYVSSEKEKVKAGQTASGPQSQSPVAIAIYSPGSRADCHSADIGVAVGMEDGSLGFKHAGHLLRRRQQSAWHDGDGRRAS